jgi:hypothetical protein
MNRSSAFDSPRIDRNPDVLGMKGSRAEKEGDEKKLTNFFG